MKEKSVHTVAYVYAFFFPDFLYKITLITSGSPSTGPQ